MTHVLLLDDGEVDVAGLVRRLRAAGTHVVVLRDFFEVPSLLDSQPFDVIIGHELLLVLALELKAQGRRWLLTSAPSEWSEQQLAALQVHAVVTGTTDDAALSALLDHRDPR